MQVVLHPPESIEPSLALLSETLRHVSGVQILLTAINNQGRLMIERQLVEK